MKILKKILNRSLATILSAAFIISAVQFEVNAADPAAPTGLNAEINQNYVALNWVNNEADSYYTVLERSIDQGAFYPITSVYKGANTYKDYSVSNGHSYKYRARTVYGKGKSEYTPEVEAIIFYPMNLSISRSYSDQVDLEWSYPTLTDIREPNYETIIEKRATDQKAWKQLAVIPSTDTIYRDSDVSSDKIYYYRIHTRYPNGNTSVNIPSNSGIATRTPYPLTTALSGYAVSTNKIMLEWDNSLSGGGKAILQKQDSDGIFYTIYTSSTNNYYIDTGLTKGQTYTYRLMLQSKNGHTSESTEEAQIITELVSMPYNFDASALSAEKILLSWDYSYATETSFEVWRKSTEAWEFLSVLPKNTLSFVDSSLTYGQTYTYKIRAKRGEAAFSRFSEPKTVNNTYPATPGELIYYTSQKNLYIYSAENVPTNAVYTLEISEGLNSNWLDYKTCTTGTLIATIPYTGQSEYRFRLRSSIGNLASYSPEFSFFGTAPDPARNFKAAIVGYDRVLLSWQDVGKKQEGYEIYRTINGIKKWHGRVDKDTQQYIDNDPVPGAYALYELFAYNAAGRTSSTAVNVSVPPVPAYNDISNYKWAHTAIYTLAGMGALDTQSGRFNPQNAVPLGQMVRLILKSFDIADDSDGLFTINDLPINHLYYRDIMTAVNLGLLHPDTDEKIYPDKNVSRGELLNLLNNTLGFLNLPLSVYGTDILVKYADHESINLSDMLIVASFTGDGIITGKSGSLLALGDRATKAEAVAIIYRALRKYR